MSEKLCVFCKHFEFDEGEEGYSELTPGSDTLMGCDLGKWDHYNLEGFGPDGFRKTILQAESCKDYVVSK